MNWLIDEAEARRLLVDLVSIDSVNPSLVPGGPGEEQVAKYIAEYAKSLGFPIQRTSWRSLARSSRLFRPRTPASKPRSL